MSFLNRKHFQELLKSFKERMHKTLIDSEKYRCALRRCETKEYCPPNAKNKKTACKGTAEICIECWDKYFEKEAENNLRRMKHVQSMIKKHGSKLKKQQLRIFTPLLYAGGLPKHEFGTGPRANMIIVDEIEGDKK